MTIDKNYCHTLHIHQILSPLTFPVPKSEEIEQWKRFTSHMEVNADTNAYIINLITIIKLENKAVLNVTIHHSLCSIIAIDTPCAISLSGQELFEILLLLQSQSLIRPTAGHLFFCLPILRVSPVMRKTSVA